MSRVLYFLRLEEEIARMKKNQERRLHRKNAKIVKEGGTPMQLNRPIKPDTTVSNLMQEFSSRLNRRLALETMWTLWSDGTHEWVFAFLGVFRLTTKPRVETNRKCPRWAEFNSGTAPVTPTPGSATSPAPTATLPNLGFNRSSSNAPFGFSAAVPSPLVTSPPMSALEDEVVPQTPKLKLTLKRNA